MKKLIITGASKGIGKDTAQIFLDSGYSIINISRTPCDLAEVQNILCDLEDADLLKEKLLALDVSKKDQITIVHNAAKLLKDNVESLKSENLESVLRVNVIAPQIINKTLIPNLGPGSSIIFIGSTLSEIGVPGAASYVTSKHALAGLMKSTCQDLAGKEIHTCLICPGFTDTEMLRKHLNNDPEVLEAVGKSNAFGRLISGNEIGHLIYFSAQSPVINGSILHGNLGQVQN